MKIYEFFHRFLRRTFLGALSGLLAGSAAAVFLYSLDWATQTRSQQPVIIWVLPLAGLGIGLLYHHFGKEAVRGHTLILDEIHDPKKVLPLRMAPFVLVGTVITHLFGGSAGREGTAVQMGASLSDQLGRFFRLEAGERKALLAAGMGAGFGAAIGAPLAGAVFGMEVIQVGKLRLFAWWECLVASCLGFFLTVALGAPHSHYPLPEIPRYGAFAFLFVAVAGLIFGLAARFFVVTTHWVERVARLVSYPPLRPVIGGLFLVFLYWLEGSYRYAGLGIPVIQGALDQGSGFREPLLKSLFTSLTVGTGFKGGEFIPLVFIGTTLGSALSLLLPLSFSFLGALGFASVFGAAANTPIACALMAMEIFGYRIGPFAFLACWLAFHASGSKSIYPGQRMHGPKHRQFFFRR